MDNKPSRRKNLIGKIVGVLLVPGLLAFSAVSIPSGVSPIDFNGAIVILYLLTISWLPVFVAFHEIGHAVAAAVVRFGFGWFRVGKLVVASRGMREFYKLHAREEGEPFGGSVLSYSTDGSKLKSRYFVVLIGGPLASILSFALAIHFSQLATMGGGIAAQYFARSAMPSATLLLIGSLLPVGSSDLATILRLVFHGYDPTKDLAMTGLAAASIGGTRPRDWNPNLVSLVSSRSGESVSDAAGSLLEYYYELDRRDYDGASQHIEHVRGLVLPDRPELNRLKNTIWNEAAFFEAAIRGNAKEARSLRAQVDESAVYHHSLLRTDAAIARVEGDWAKMTQLANEAIREQAGFFDRGWATAERDILSEYTDTDRCARP